MPRHSRESKADAPLPSADIWARLGPHEKLALLIRLYPKQAAAFDVLMDHAWETQERLRERLRQERQARARLKDR